MSTPGNPSEFIEVRKTSDYTITNDDITTRGHFVNTSYGITWTLPTPAATHHQKEMVFSNYTGEFTSVVCNSGFVDGNDGFVLHPYESAYVRCSEVGSTTYRWQRDGHTPLVNARWQTWTPTLSWTTATPTLSTAIYRYIVIDGVCLFYINVASADGAGATALTATLPITPHDVDIEIPVKATQTIAGTATNALGYVDAANNTIENRLLEFQNFSTWTDDAACSLEISGFYFVDDSSTTTASPTETWTTGTPASITNTMEHKVVGDICFFAYSTTSADSNACTELTVALPVVLRDKNDYIPVNAIQLNNATYSDPDGYLDGTNNTGASRLLEFGEFSTVGDGQTVTVTVAGFYEVGDTWRTYTDSLSWTTATPTSVTQVARCTKIGPVGFFTTSMSSSDGNGATDLTCKTPIPAAYTSSKIPIANYQTQHTDTFSDPMAYIAANQSSAASRLVNFESLTTADDGEAVGVHLAGFYEVAD